jgi:hypothetical protein
MCGNIAKVIATGISIDFNGGILVGMSERMNAAILERGWSTKRLAARKGDARAPFSRASLSAIRHNFRENLSGHMFTQPFHGVSVSQ